MSATAYYRREGQSIVAPDGAPEFRRGMGLGGWLLPEGYMWDLPAPVDSPRRMEQFVLELIGPERAARFWSEYRRRFITAEDIALIAAAGFDHVRLPINARIVFDGTDLIDEGIALVDRTVDWCRDEGISCVLDLHGAPGGQTGENIDDSPHRRPELFTDPAAYEEGLRLWGLLASRYADEPVIAAYDVLNEPLPEKHEALVPKLAEFYRDVVAEIRAVDPNHLLSIEGWNWATRFDGIDQLWDPNSCLHFHKYWSEPSTDSIRSMLDLRERLDLPLWMGESGENDDQWYTEAFGLFEQHGIPWTFWTWKKVDRPTSPLIITRPDRWDEVVRCAAGTGPAPQDADEIFDQLLELLPAARCAVRRAALAALPGISAPAADLPDIRRSGTHRDIPQDHQEGQIR